MHIKHLEKLVSESLEDLKLDRSEKYSFNALSEALEVDDIGFIKNKAFELARPYVEAGGGDAVKVLKWLERLLKAIQKENRHLRIQPSAYFSPGRDCKDKIISLMNAAKHSIKICVFTISDNDITKSILAAHKRNIEVTIISDNDKSNDRGSDIDFLKGKGLNVILDRSPYHMHHKFAIFDDGLLLNGSFNWTRSASDVNEENILITADAKLVSMFRQQFKSLQARYS